MDVPYGRLSRFHSEILAGSGERDRPFPWRMSRDPYAVLVGEVMLQRTRGENVVGAYREFLRRWPTPARLARAHLSTISRVMRPLGLSRRASTMKKLGRAIEEAGGVPIDPVDLAALPGVGPYASHAVPVFALGRNLPVVDWVIARVLRRYFDMSGTSRPNQDGDLWRLAADLAAQGEARTLWLGVLDLAALVCKPMPRCDECPLCAECAYSQRRRAG